MLQQRAAARGEIPPRYPVNSRSPRWRGGLPQRPVPDSKWSSIRCARP